MSFVTLGKSKVSIFLNSIVLVCLIFYAATTLFSHFSPSIDKVIKSNVSASYYELEILKGWAPDYDQTSIEELLHGYSKSQDFVLAKSKIDEILKNPEMSITIFQDQLMDGSGIGWVVRFEFANTSGNSDHSQKAANIMGKQFTAHVKSNT